MDVELCRLVDGKVSVRLDGTEIYILPKKDECDLDSIQVAMQNLLDEAVTDHKEISSW